MQRTNTLITCLALTACVPLPKDAGWVEEPTDTGTAGASDTDAEATADAATETDGAPAEADIEWSLQIDGGRGIFALERAPEGVAAVLQGDPQIIDDTELVAISTTMDPLWSVTLSYATIHDLDVLGGDEYLVVGASSGSAGGDVNPTAWLYHCCDDLWIQPHPQPTGGPAAIIAAVSHSDGIFMVIDDGELPTSFVQTEPHALAPTSLEGSLDMRVLDASRTPGGNVLLQASEGGDAHLLYEVEHDGTGSGWGNGQLTTLVGEDDGLRLMTFGNQEVAIEQLAGGPVVPVPIPGFSQQRAFVADGRVRFAFAHDQEDPAGGSTVHLTEFADDGVVARTLALPHQQHPYATPTAIAVGEDDAIYLAVAEHDGANQTTTWLHRIAPL